jgi:hypothetical protein
MKSKTTIRYERFRTSQNGGRIFDFWVSESDRPAREMSVEIPLDFLEGQNRIHLQEGVGISYAKIKHFLEIGESPETLSLLCLNAADLALHRQIPPATAKKRHRAA